MISIQWEGWEIEYHSYDTLEEAKDNMATTSGDYKYIYDRIDVYVCYSEDD